MAGFIAEARTVHGVPHTVSCRVLEVSQSWFYKWHQRIRTGQRPERDRRRERLDEAVAAAFTASGSRYGSPRIVEDLWESGWRISENTVAESMQRQDLVARLKKRRKGLTRPDKAAVGFPDLVQRDFTAPAPNTVGVGDMTEIPTGEGKLYAATVIDLFSRRLLACATSDQPDAELAGQAIKTALAVRGGAADGVVFHTDRGSTYTAHSFTELCQSKNITQSMGRVGSCFDNAAAESFFSTLEHEVLFRHDFENRKEARETVVNWVYDFYNKKRRHSSCGMQSPINYELAALAEAA